jgi:hypothetical protein
MRHILPAIAAIVLAAPALAQDPTGISSAAISRCAGKIGMDTRQSDPAFGTIMLDGMPWTTVEPTEEKLGAQVIATTVSGTGARRRRDGTLVTFRFTCKLDTEGQALVFRAWQLLPGERGVATVVAGSAAYARKLALPHGAELCVQLLDAAAQSPSAGRAPAVHMPTMGARLRRPTGRHAHVHHKGVRCCAFSRRRADACAPGLSCGQQACVHGTLSASRAGYFAVPLAGTAGGVGLLSASDEIANYWLRKVQFQFE